MMNEKVLKALNRQINRELYSAYLYLSMAAYAASTELRGFLNWFNVQAKEELAHADKIYNYVIQNSGRVIAEDIEAPPTDFGSPVDLFAKTLEHEKKVTGMIHDLVELAKKEKDKPTEDFLQWFVKEQQEEEESASGALEKVKAAKDEGSLKNVNAQLATRKG